MQAIERAAYLAHSRTRGYRRKVDKALELLSGAAALGRRPYIAFSTGKDSTVCLDLARRVWPQAPALHGHDEWLLPEMEAMLATTPNCRQLAGRRQHAEGFIAWENGPENLPEGVEWVEDSASPMVTWARRHGLDTSIIGIRADENNRRRKQIRARGQYFYARSRAMWHLYPVAWWSVSDIWAYIVSRDIAYCAAYDRLSELGIPAREQRIGPLVVENVAALGQVAILKRGWPELFSQICERYPALAGYA